MTRKPSSMEHTISSLAGVLSTLGISYLQTLPETSTSHRVWTEWAAWGSIALACRIYTARSTSQPNSPNDKEAQYLPKWIRPRLEKPAAAIAILFIASFCITIPFSEQILKWAYVSSPNQRTSPSQLTAVAFGNPFYLYSDVSQQLQINCISGSESRTVA